MYAIIPVVVGAWIALFARYRYAYSLEKRRRWIGALVGGYCFLIIAGVTYHLLWHRLRFVFLALLLTLVVLNSQFYVFLAGARGTLFAVAAIPFHLLYFVYSGVGFMVALIRHSLRKLLPTTTGVTGFTPSAKEAKVKATTP
jgi:hypothetical protein